MIDLFNELEQLAKVQPLPYDRKLVRMPYSDNISSREMVIFCSPTMVISIYANFEEVEMQVYFYSGKKWVAFSQFGGGVLSGRRVKQEKEDKVIRDPNDVFFKKHNEKWTHEENLTHDVRLLYDLLIRNGDDLLQGKDTWIHEASSPPRLFAGTSLEELYTIFVRQGIIHNGDKCGYLYDEKDLYGYSDTIQTPIILTNGQIKKISEIEIGDEVWARPYENPSGELVKTKVVETFIYDRNQCSDLVFNFEEWERMFVIFMPRDQQIFTLNKGWINMDAVEFGDVIESAAGMHMKTSGSYLSEQRYRFYNFKVEKCGTYFIGIDLATCVLVRDASDLNSLVKD